MTNGPDPVSWVDGPAGRLEVRVVGHGEPVTVFAHGLASSIDETRPFASSVSGTRVFFSFRGHGHSAAPESAWTYAGLRDELLAVVRRYSASRALGVSLGAGALLRAVWTGAAAFERVVFVLPSAIDLPRHDSATRRMRRMSELVERRDDAALARSLVAEQPVDARDRADVEVWASRRAARLLGEPIARALRDLPPRHPLPRGADLAGIATPALVIGQEGDDAHPSSVARELARRLPNARLEMFDARGLLWAHRSQLRQLISGFLNVG